MLPSFVHLPDVPRALDITRKYTALLARLCLSRATFKGKKRNLSSFKILMLRCFIGQRGCCGRFDMTHKRMVLALSLVAILLVATGVGGAAIATRAAAQPTAPYTIPVDGLPHVFTSAMLNYAEVLQSTGPTASASGNTITFDNTSQGHGNGCYTYMGAGLSGISDQIQGSYTSDQLASIPATITVKGTWTASLTATSPDVAIVAVQSTAASSSFSSQQESLAFFNTSQVGESTP